MVGTDGACLAQAVRRSKEVRRIATSFFTDKSPFYKGQAGWPAQRDNSAGEDEDRFHVLCGVQIDNVLGRLATVAIGSHIKGNQGPGSADFAVVASIYVQFGFYFGNTIGEQQAIIDSFTRKSLDGSDTLIVCVWPGVDN